MSHITERKCNYIFILSWYITHDRVHMKLNLLFRLDLQRFNFKDFEKTIWYNLAILFWYIDFINLSFNSLPSLWNNIFLNLKIVVFEKYIFKIMCYEYISIVFLLFFFFNFGELILFRLTTFEYQYGKQLTRYPHLV